MIDEKDIKIIDELRKDGRLSAQEISKKTKIPTTTIFNRIKKLEKENVIKKYTVVTDDSKISSTTNAYILLTIDYSTSEGKKISQNKISSELIKHEFVREVSIVTGTNDIIIKVNASDLKNLNNFVTSYLRNIKGIERTQTSVIMENFKVGDHG